MKRVVLAALLSTISLTMTMGLLPAGVTAAGDPAATSVKLTTTPRLDAKGHKIKGEILLVVTLTTNDGKPVTGRSVPIYERVQFMGKEREAKLGIATTDSTGTGAINYQPSETGAHALVARFAGDSDYAKTEISTTAQVTEVVPPFPAQETPLSSVRHWLSLGVGLFVLLFWAYLIGLFLRTVWGVWSAGRGSVLAEDTGVMFAQDGIPEIAIDGSSD